MNVSAVLTSADASSSNRIVAVSLPNVAAFSGVTFRWSITVDVRAFGEQHAHDFRGRIRKRRNNQRRPSAARGNVHVGAMVEQQTNLLRVGDRPHQSRGAVRIHRVDVGAPFDQHLHGVHRTDCSGIHQRRDLVGPLGVCTHAFIEKSLQSLKIVGADRRIQVVMRFLSTCVKPSGKQRETHKNEFFRHGVSP